MTLHQATTTLLDHVSNGASAGHNEDHVVIVQAGDTTDLIVLDGATSVAERNYLAEQGDVVWFVHRFGAALESAIHSGLDQHAAVHAAIDTVRAEFLARAAGADIPLHAWPIAALTWIRCASR